MLSACTRTTVENEDTTRLAVALHAQQDARNSQYRGWLQPGGRAYPLHWRKPTTRVAEAPPPRPMRNPIPLRLRSNGSSTRAIGARGTGRKADDGET